METYQPLPVDPVDPYSGYGVPPETADALPITLGSNTPAAKFTMSVRITLPIASGTSSTGDGVSGRSRDFISSNDNNARNNSRDGVAAQNDETAQPQPHPQSMISQQCPVLQPPIATALQVLDRLHPGGTDLAASWRLCHVSNVDLVARLLDVGLLVDPDSTKPGESFCLSLWLHVYLGLYLYVNLYVCLSVCLLVCPSDSLSVYICVKSSVLQPVSGTLCSVLVPHDANTFMCLSV